MKVSATIRSSHNVIETTLETNDSSRHLTLPTKPSGFGSSVSGGELLLLALATCYCNDIYREAAKKDIRVLNVHVEVDATFDAAGEPGSGFEYKAYVDAEAKPEEIRELIEHTDRVAEIHNTLRKGAAIKLVH
jgi:uncharacterized OsmC-like protein